MTYQMRIVFVFNYLTTVSGMKHVKPINLLYLPVWYVGSMGLSTIRSYQSMEEVLEPILKIPSDSEDSLMIQASNFALSNWLYGSSQLAMKVKSDEEFINICTLQGVDVENYQTNNLLESIFGTQSKEYETADQDSRFAIVCRSFEDVVIKVFANGDILIYADPQAVEYHSRERAVKKLVSTLIDFTTYKQAVKSELFRTYLASSYKEEDMKHALYHRVG